MKTLREILVEHNTSEGYGVSDKSLEETLREGYPVVWEGNEDSHRWRIDFDCVCKIIDEGIERFFRYSACKGTNENDWEGAGYYFEGIDNVCEVVPKEVTTVKYVKI